MRRALALLGLVGAFVLLAAATAEAVHREGQMEGRGGVLAQLPAVRLEEHIQDVYVDQAEPDTNFNEGEGAEFLVVRADPDTPAVTLLRFPIEQLPRNATILDAWFNLTTETNTGGRSLILKEIRDPWNEDEVTWSRVQGMAIGAEPMNNHSSQGQFPGVPEFDRLLTETFENFCPNPFPGPNYNCPEEVGVGLTDSFRRAYLGERPYYGHYLRDDSDEPTGGVSMTQRYFSSSSFNEAERRPFLSVMYHPNGPQFRQLLVDGKERVNATSTRPVNLSFEVFDEVGTIVDAWVNATTPEGQEVFNRSVFDNRTTMLLNVPRHLVWSNESLGLPPGRYFLNAWGLDNDGNLMRMGLGGQRQANITVENDLPFLNHSRVSASDLGEGDPFTASVTADDASGIRSVTLEVRRGVEVLANLTLEAVSVDQNRSGDYRLTTKAVWAGALNLTLWAEDTAGNINRSVVFPLRVHDNQAPVILEAKVVAPGFGPQGPFQEDGGRVAWEARIQDASPLVVTLELNPPSGGKRVIAMPRVPGSLDGFRYAENFTERGSYGAVLIAKDPDGNTASRAGLGFVLLDGAPPAIEGLQPKDGAWAPAKPVVSAVVRDLNLDATSIVMDLRVAPDPFLRAETHISFESETARRISTEEPFFHNETVEVRVAARDLLGHAGDRTWSFRVDAQAPLTILTSEGAFLSGNRSMVTGATNLRLERSDRGSGVLATVLGITNEDAGLRSGNISLPGDAPAALNFSGSPVYRGTGNYTLFVSTVDVAGNVEAVQQHRFLVDDSPPEVIAAFEPGLLTARVVERGAGLKDVRAQFWVSPGGQQGVVPMSPASEDRSLWQARIPDAPRGAQVLFAVTATDLLGNTGSAGTEASPLRSIVQNHPPVVTLQPPNGSLVKGVVAVSWSVVDADGDPLEVSVAVRPSTSDRIQELATRRGATGNVDWDTRGAGDGLWVLQVRARDGFEEVVALSLVDVVNTGSRIVALNAKGGDPGQPVRIEATLYTPVERAQAVVRLRGQEIAKVPLRDDGAPPDRRAADGVFTGQFVPKEPGDYRIDLDVLFQGGRQEKREPAATLEVQYAFPGRIVHEPLLLLLMIGVPVAVAGVWLWRRYGPVKPRR